MIAVRPSAVAGSFFPDDPGKLRRQVESLLSQSAPGSLVEDSPVAIIAPHAGYRYSGKTAGIAFQEFAHSDEEIERVVVLGPSHRVDFRGLALPGCDAFDTPLGAIPVDGDLVARIEHLPQVHVNVAAHAREHSIEVELPFLTVLLGGYQVLPLVVGRATPDDVAEILCLLCEIPEIKVVVSSDLSHYLPDIEARRMDQSTANRILNLDSSLRPKEACGFVPINGLLSASRDLGLIPRLLDLRNSGPTSGDLDQVVGYGAFAFDRKEN